MKILNLLEEKFNQLFYKLRPYFLKIIILFIPKKLIELKLGYQNKLFNSLQVGQEKLEHLLKYTINESKTILVKVKSAITFIMVNVNKVLGFPYKETVLTFILNLSKFLKNANRQDYKVLFENFKAKIYQYYKDNLLPPIAKHQKYILKFVYVFIIILPLLSFGLLKGVRYFKRQFPQLFGDGVHKAQMMNRPIYYKRETKLIPLDNLSIPIYMYGDGSMKALYMDLTIEATNRFIVLYFMKRGHEIRDYLVSKIEPIMPTMPLNEEGKQILREKIKLELNNYLAKRKIRGQITNVYIEGIIAD